MDSFPINILDLVVGLIVLLSALFAAYRGFVREVLAIAGWVGAAAVTIWLFPYGRPYASEFIPTEQLADLATGAVIFVAALIVFWILTRMIVSLVKDSALNALDRSLGFLFGIARGMVLLALIYMIAARALWQDGEIPVWAAEARTLPIIQQTSELIVSVVPADMVGFADDAAENIDKGADSLKTIEERLETMRRMAEPPVAPTDGENTQTGYKEADQRAMDRLQETIRDLTSEKDQ